MSLLDIGTVARRSGLTPAALRFYEQRGLIAPASRLGLRRQYNPAVLERLALVTLAQRAGFTLDEIAATLGPADGLSPDRALLKARARQIDRTLRQLSALRDALVHAAGCTAPNHEDCTDFHRLMQIATGREPRHGTPPAPARPAPFAGDRGPEDSETA